MLGGFSRVGAKGNSYSPLQAFTCNILGVTISGERILFCQINKIDAIVEIVGNFFCRETQNRYLISKMKELN